MNQEKINTLKNKFFELFPEECNTNFSDGILTVEKGLSLQLPEDFLCISKFFNGDNGIIFNTMYAFTKNGGDWNICDQTLKLRESVNFPRNMIVLAEPDESIVVMETIPNDQNYSKVYWISIGDAYNLIEGKPLEDNPTIFPTFTDFFAYLLDEEEKHRTKAPSV